MSKSRSNRIQQAFPHATAIGPWMTRLRTFCLALEAVADLIVRELICRQVCEALG